MREEREAGAPEHEPAPAAPRPDPLAGQEAERDEAEHETLDRDDEDADQREVDRERRARQAGTPGVGSNGIRANHATTATTSRATAPRASMRPSSATLSATVNAKAPMIPYMYPGCIPDRRLMSTHTAASTSVHKRDADAPVLRVLAHDVSLAREDVGSGHDREPEHRDAEHHEAVVRTGTPGSGTSR